MNTERVEISYQNIVFTILFIAALILAFYARYILLSALIGIGIGVLTTPVLAFFRSKLHLPKAVSALLVFVGFLLVTALVLGSLYFMVADQVQSLSERAPKIISSLEGWIASMFEKYPWIRQQISDFNFGRSLNTGAMSLYKGFQTGFMALSGVVFAIIIGLYSAVDGKLLFDKSVEAFYPHRREKARRVMKNCAQVLRGWFKAQLVDMGIIGTLTAIGLWIAGVEYWAIFGLLTAFLGIIPYVGIILVVMAATLVTLASDPSKAPWVLFVFLVTQQLEGNVILPLVMKGKAELPVVPLLIFMLLLGTFFGVLGVFLAPPLLAILRTLYIEIYLPYINRPRTPELASAQTYPPED